MVAGLHFIDQSHKMMEPVESSCCGDGSYFNSLTSTRGDLDVAENFLAKELARLSMEERQKVFDDIHGVADLIEESPELVSTSLREMREAILKLPKRRKRALEWAIYLRPALETDDGFHLMFLRSERFDPIKAAHKLCRHLEYKLDLFGIEKLAKRITLDDLDEKAMKFLNEGHSKFLPYHDRIGRGIISVHVPGDCDPASLKSYLKQMWYEIMVAAEDEDIQSKGYVSVLNFFGEGPNTMAQFVSFLSKGREITSDWPLRCKALHFCSDRTVFRNFLGLFKLIDNENRLRFRAHFGSTLEVQYALTTFGIVLPDVFRVNHCLLSPDLIRSIHEDRRKQESQWSYDDFKVRPWPSPHHVLMGRGRPFSSWPGNELLSIVVTNATDRYIKTEDNFGKTLLAIDIVQRMKDEHNCRFMQRTHSGWEEVDDNTARTKISQALRSSARNYQATKLPCNEPHYVLHNQPSLDEYTPAKKLRNE